MARASAVDRLRAVARAHPVLATAGPPVFFAWIAFGGFIAAGLDPSPAILGLSLFFIVLLVGVNWLIGGWTEVRRTFARLLRWRFGVVAWAVVLLGSPLATLAVAAVTGTLRAPEGGFGQMLVTYLVSTFLIGALLVNLWEESLWGGMVQGRLMARHGLLAGSLLSAIPFALVHLPLAFGPPMFLETPLGQVALVWAIMIGSAPFFRYLMGMILIETRGSTLAIGLMHASWNACSSLPAVDGGWQYIVALGVLVAVLAASRLLRGQPVVAGRVTEPAGEPAAMADGGT